LKSLLLIAAIMACVGLIAALLVMSYMVNTIPSTSSSGGNLFNYSVSSTLSYFAIPTVLLLCLAFLAFLAYLLKERG